MQESSTKKIYDVHSMFYDATFGRLVKRRIERAIREGGLRDTAALGRALQCGTNCGSCLPELREILSHECLVAAE